MSPSRPRGARPGVLIVSERARCIYCIVPKVACSNWIMLLRRLDGFDDWRVPSLVYDHNANGLTYMSHEVALRSLDLDRYVKFTFVRSPFTRLLARDFEAFGYPTSLPTPATHAA